MIRLPEIPSVDLGPKIGGGAFGHVFRGRHRVLDVDVAVKLIETTLVNDAASVLQEARLMARLDHPNLLRIFDAGQAGDVLYLILELMDGTSASVRPLVADRAVDLARQLLSGLQALHAARILHRDLKPANCLVRRSDGRIKVADLGIAIEQSLLTASPHSLAGTLPFMAPELFDAPPRFSAASDLYAIGRTLQCLVLERDPFPRLSTGALVAWIQRGEPVDIASSRPDLPAALATMIDRLCARDPSHRPTDAAEALAGLSAGAPPIRARSTDTTATALIVGSWVLGTDIPGDANFHVHAATHVRTGAAARIALLKRHSPLSEMSPLILASADRASTLSHPGIAPVVDWGLHDGRAFVVTRAQGRDLETLIQSGGPMDEIEALSAARDLADALAYLHGAGLVYQVVNPLFAVLTPDARSIQLAWPMFCVEPGSAVPAGDTDARLIGRKLGSYEVVAKLGEGESNSLLISVPRYAAPEVLVRRSRRHIADHESSEPRDEHLRITERADLYGLGEILYYLIAGRPICDADLEPPALIFRKASGPHRLREVVPSVLASTDRLVADLTAPDPKNRPASAAIVRDRLNAILNGVRANP